jgi:hypothetical protein
MTDKSTAAGASPRIKVTAIAGRTPEYALVQTEIDPEIRHASLSLNASGELFGGDAADVMSMAEVLKDVSGLAALQDMTFISRTLSAQACSLDALFTQMVRRAHMNLGQYPDAADRYLRLAMKAQAQSRSTMESLVRMHQPREQTVRHIHVGPDGRAVFIENLHGGLGNARFDERPHAQGSPSPALLGNDAGRNGVPLAGGEGEAAVSHARRGSPKRRASRKQ